MKKHIELPLVEPLYSTYHFQGVDTALAVNSNSLRNRCLNEVLMLTCEKRFLNGYSSPEINVQNSSWNSHKNIIKVWTRMEFLDGHINYVIKRMIEDGFYVYFNNVDDYYIKDKTWYNTRHFSHDGLICGYDIDEKQYCIFAYDNKWIYRKFWTPWDGFEKGRKAIFKSNRDGKICGLKESNTHIDFLPEVALENIILYLDSDLGKYPFEDDSQACGFVVHQYIEKYIDMLISETIQYERIDRRVFRLIWEHKKVMFERIRKIEEAFKLTDESSKQYSEVVSEANQIRGLYASYLLKKRPSILPIIKTKFKLISEKEYEILNKIVCFQK